MSRSTSPVSSTFVILFENDAPTSQLDEATTCPACANRYDAGQHEPVLVADAGLTLTICRTCVQRAIGQVQSLSSSSSSPSSLSPTPPMHHAPLQLRDGRATCIPLTVLDKTALIVDLAALAQANAMCVVAHTTTCCSEDCGAAATKRCNGCQKAFCTKHGTTHATAPASCSSHTLLLDTNAHAARDTSLSLALSSAVAKCPLHAHLTAPNYSHWCNECERPLCLHCVEDDHEREHPPPADIDTVAQDPEGQLVTNETFERVESMVDACAHASDSALERSQFIDAHAVHMTARLNDLKASLVELIDAEIQRTQVLAREQKWSVLAHKQRLDASLTSLTSQLRAMQAACDASQQSDADASQVTAPLILASHVRKLVDRVEGEMHLWHREEHYRSLQFTLDTTVTKATAVTTMESMVNELDLGASRSALEATALVSEMKRQLIVKPRATSEDEEAFAQATAAVGFIRERAQERQEQKMQERQRREQKRCSARLATIADMGEIARFMREHALLPVIQVVACERVRELMHLDQSACARAIDAGIAQAVVDALVTHASDASVAASACGLLHMLVVSASHQAKVSGIDGVPAVLSALARHAGNGIAVIEAFRALGSLTAISDAGDTIMLPNVENQSLIARLGGIDAVVKSLRERSWTADIVQEACRALSRVAYKNDDNQLKIVTAGGIVALLDAMRDHASNAGAIESACRALMIISANDYNQVKIGTAGGIAAVLKAMRNHGSNAGVIEQACGALAGVVKTYTGNVADLASAGGIEVLLKAMRDHASHARVMEHALSALASMARRPESKLTIAASGGIEVLLKAMHDHASHASVMEHALSALSSVAGRPENKPTIVAAALKAMRDHATNVSTVEKVCGVLVRFAQGNDDTEVIGVGIATLFKSIRDHASNASVITSACRSILTMSRTGRARYDTRVQVVTMVGVNALMKAMHDHASNAGVVEAVCGVLAHITENYGDNKAKIVSAGGIEALLNALDFHPASVAIHLYVTSVLLDLCNDGNHARMVQAYAIPRLQRARGRFPQHSTEVDAVLELLRS